MIRITIESGTWSIGVDYKGKDCSYFSETAKREFTESECDKRKILRKVAKAIDSMLAEIKLKKGVKP